VSNLRPREVLTAELNPGDEHEPSCGALLDLSVVDGINGRIPVDWLCCIFFFWFFFASRQGGGDDDQQGRGMFCEPDIQFGAPACVAVQTPVQRECLGTLVSDPHGPKGTL